MNNKDTLVLEIGKDIKKHRELEIKENIKNIAVALANVYYYGSDKKMWITNSPNDGGYNIIRNILGEATGTSQGRKSTLTSDGYAIYKNTKIGGKIIMHSDGEHLIDTPKGKEVLKILNKSTFIPNPHYSDAEDLQMNIGEKKPRFYRKLSDLLKQPGEVLEKLNKEIEDLEKKTNE